MEGDRAGAAVPRPAAWLVAGSAAASCGAAVIVAAASGAVPVAGGDRAVTALCAFTIAALTFALTAVAAVAAPDDTAAGVRGAPRQSHALHGARDGREGRDRDRAPVAPTARR